MNGFVDDELRALVNVKIGAPELDNFVEATFWVELNWRLSAVELSGLRRRTQLR